MKCVHKCMMSLYSRFSQYSLPACLGCGAALPPCASKSALSELPSDRLSTHHPPLSPVLAQSPRFTDEFSSTALPPVSLLEDISGISVWFMTVPKVAFHCFLFFSIQSSQLKKSFFSEHFCRIPSEITYTVIFSQSWIIYFVFKWC